MKQYMRDQFEFAGISSGERKELMRRFWKASKLPGEADLPAIVQALWQKPEREFQYFSMELCKKMQKKIGKEHIQTLQFMLKNKQWWDTIDFIAADLMGYHLTKFPELLSEYFPQWNESSDIWLNRTALLFQLKYKEKTNTGLLTEAILRHRNSKEFFIRKAIGWALRQYSKTNPTWVRAFLENHELPGLSRKEAQKYL